MGQEITSYDAQLAEMAARYAEQEQLSGGTFLSTRGGTLSFGDTVMPGNQACVIVLDAVKENTYYPDDFDPDTPAAPRCYAFGRDNDVMGPHPSMQLDLNYFKPQAVDCSGCSFNEWGSADKGRGKACQNRRRLALVPAGYYSPKRGSRDFDLEIFTDPDHYKKSDIAFIKLPVLSVKNWSKYVTQIANSIHRTPRRNMPSTSK